MTDYVIPDDFFYMALISWVVGLCLVAVLTVIVCRDRE